MGLPVAISIISMEAIVSLDNLNFSLISAMTIFLLVFAHVHSK